MKKAIIDYLRKPAGTVKDRATTVSSNLYTVAIFAAPPVTKVALDAQAGVVEAAITAAAGNDRHMLAELRKQKKVLAIMLRQLAEYVNTIVQDGDEAKLLSSGFEISKTPEKDKVPGAIAKVTAVYTDLSGIINLSWSTSRFARYYNVFMSADNGQTWTMLDTVFGRKMLVEQLISGKRYQFKIVPVGKSGTGPVSDIASQVAA
jgi:hypothetical protein